jgi:hypothetical protein
MKALFIMLYLTVLAWSGPAGAVTVFTVHPPAGPVQPGTAFDLHIDASGASDLFAWQFSLVFDPAVLSFQGVAEGSFLAGAGGTLFLPGVAGGNALSLVANTLIGALPGASGAGRLATLSFVALAEGSSALHLADMLILDSTLQPSAVTGMDGAVLVAAPVPEPGAAAMLLAGLAALAGLLAARAARRATGAAP